VNVTPADDASFTTVDFCASSVNTISGVATPGGTYTITGQTGSGLATIDGTTGVLANYVAGDQITIEYATPSGVCQNTSTLAVNVTPLDDATFVSTDFCASTVNTISGVAIPGGTYSITVQTGSGLATINGSTGVLANYVVGDQVTIEYTTPAGGCQNSSSLVVNVLPADDAMFVTSDFCESSVNTISGVATLGGTYVITGQTGSGLATINGATGVLANYVAGDQVTIQYTTPAGACQTSSSIVVNVTPADDASFTTVDFCISSVNTISSVVVPGGSYTITGQTGSGLATINSGTGVLSNYVAGDQVTIQYTTPAGGCQNSSSQVVNVTNLDNASFVTADFCESSVNVISSVATAGGTYAITGQTGSGLVTINGGTGILSNYVAGDQVTIEYTTPGGGCQNSSSLVVNVTPLDDASFTTVDFCVSSANTISAVALIGGTYSITGQTGSGLATINGGTGVLSNFVAGDQVTIQHLTPAGGCQNTSTQVVNVLPLDDASFTSVDFCVFTVNTISAVASPGGTYTITGQTGSGLVTINSGTGTLSNYLAGDQVTIEYTTPVGGCQNTSMQVVNVTPLDDASFATSDFCFSSVNVVSAVALPGGSYAITSQTGSGLVTINSGTGVLSNYVAGDQITIEYTTPAGGCQNTSTQVVNVTPLDDASFTTVDFCESSVNIISGVATPGGTYVISGQTGSGLATINGGTGVLANYVAGDQVTIEYTTPAGGCQNTSSQVVNITPLDDASFTTSDFCISVTNTISAVASPGGTYTITGQTGSGLATINSGTGVLANYVAGDQITIQYATPSGVCQNTSTLVVNVTPLDDATFVSSDFCASATNTISGVVTPGGTYAISGQTGSGLATINGSTGVLANYVVGDQVTIEYTTPAVGCQNSSSLVVNVLPADDASFTTSDFCASSVNVISAVTTPGGTYTISGQTGSGLVTIDGSTGVLSNYIAGDQVTIQYTTPAGACQTSSSIVVNVTPADDASFTTVDFCASSVNTISGVATPGGTYTITGQTGSGLATIDGTTGVLANYVAGDQVTIEYTTPAGGCQNSSTQIVNVLPSDDATFVSTDFCASATNTISGVVTPGGTYTIAGQTGSGLATINGSTGVLANYVVGDQVTIEYTTPAGGCTNTYTQIVNVTPMDDASFTTSDFCEASVNVISAVAISGGTYVITGQTGSGLATINGSTGVLANYIAGDQITIEYTTPAGGCQNTSTQVINVTAQDDPSFTSVDFCESSVNAISAVAVPGGTFTIAIQSGTATIDGTTGVLSGYAVGDQITIEYTTPAGSCQNSSTQIVTVVPTDNGVFTMTASCDGGTVNLTGLAGGVFSFLNAPTDGATIDPATGTVSGGTSGTNYDVEFTTNGLCPVITSQSVVALDLDVASFVLTPTCDGATATVLGTAGGSFTFSIAPVDAALIDASTGDISGGDYNSSYAVVYNTAGVCPASSIENVIVDDCSVPISIVIPTAFTPGSDGVNGTWEIQDLDNNYPDNSVIVYNRWGSVVFEYTSNAANPYSLNKWDGTFNGQELPVASYYYIITGNDGGDDSFKGTVTIVRN
jgi:gliding motility-associated-like protein